MLETLREFAAERLADAGEERATRARHANYYLELAEREAPRFTGRDPAAALDRVAPEHDTVRAALGELIDHDPEGALRLGAAMWRFWQMRGYLHEGGRWLRGALQAAGPNADDRWRVEAVAAIGSLAYWVGDLTQARPYYEEAVAIRRTIGDDARTASALYDLSFMFSPLFFPLPADPERTERAAALLGEAQELYRRVGGEAGIAKTGWMLGILAMYRDLPEAALLLRTAVEQFRRLDDPFDLGWALRMYGCSLLGLHDTAAAGDAFREALGIFSAANDGSGLGMLLGDAADLARLEGDAVRAARLKGASAGLRQLSETELANVEEVPWLAGTPALAEMLGPAELAQAWADGRSMSQAEALAYALGGGVAAEPSAALRVTALGPFAVERSGERLSHWGGAKAGSRQAQAIFGFLFDRGERGVTKDELIEVIWPDAEVAQGDLNFHRTLGGLRATLEPDQASSGRRAIAFENGRYRLGRHVVGWDDVSEFERHLQHAAQATDEGAAIRELEEARSLYRSDFLDDCPVYGDSEYVEERRTTLRGRLSAALVDLGHRYERRGDEALAAARFREALGVAGGEHPSAREGLDRLGAAIG
jgi:tetratricopeptide (TPR) repeat protein